MIERLNRSERWIIAERQRWLSYILVATGLVLLLMVILSLIVLSVDKRVRNIDIMQVAMVFPVVLPFLYLPLIYCFIGISVRYPVSTKPTWWLVVLIALIPVLQFLAGIVLCVILLRDWRQQGLHVRWYGPTAAALRAMEIRDLCHQCEYDLTGNESGVCPECGANIKRPLHMKSRESMEQIEVFWLEFIRGQNALRQAQSADDAAYDRLLQHLQKIDNRLYIEFATGDELELIITAHGDCDCFAVVDDVVAAAPDDTGWKIFALKPRLGFPEVAEYEGFEVRMAEARFEPLQREGSQDLGLRVYVPNWRADQAEQAWQTIMNACEHGLGERVFANRVQHVEVRPYETDADLSELIPLVDLDRFLGLD